MVAGANEEIDEESCAAGDPSTCPFTSGVGVSGVYFSFDSRHELDAADLQRMVGSRLPRAGRVRAPRGRRSERVPNYFEAGLVADGDPAVAFGPRPGADGNFSFSNGSRLYYANLTSNFAATRTDATFKGFEAIAVSHVDDVTAAAHNVQVGLVGSGARSPSSRSTTFSDKEQIWADNAASSPLFGNVYVCWASFRSNSRRQRTPVPLTVSRSSDGGVTWTTNQVGPATANGHQLSARRLHRADGQQGQRLRVRHREPERRRVRNDVQVDRRRRPLRAAAESSLSRRLAGRVRRSPRPPGDGRHRRSPRRPRCRSQRRHRQRCPHRGRRHRPDRAELGRGADGLNHEHAAVHHLPRRGCHLGDAASHRERRRPAGSTPRRRSRRTEPTCTSSTTRSRHRSATTPPIRAPSTGVFLHADVSAWASRVPSPKLFRGTPGDPRGTSQNGLTAEFLGDYVYAAATRTYGTGGVERRKQRRPPAALSRPTVNRWRPAASVPAPNVLGSCPADFGNSDILGQTIPDPTP